MDKHSRPRNVDFDLLFGKEVPEYTYTEKSRLFNSLVSNIVCEVHSYCNRTCSFCPNSFIDRRTETFFMNEAIYEGLLDTLSKSGYPGGFSYSRYNEPMANPVTLKAIEKARASLPSNRLAMNTNGDYVNNTSLEELVEAGLSALSIQVYTEDLPSVNRFEESPRTLFGDYFTKLLSRAPQLAGCLKLVHNSFDVIRYSGSHRGMDIEVKWRDFSINGTNRADLEVVPEKVRTSPCTVVRNTIHIDYNGKVMPCCNLRSDYGPHAPFALGDISDQGGNIVDIFFNQIARDFRRSLSNFQEKDFPCRNCSFLELPDDQVVIDREKAIEQAIRDQIEP